MMVGPNVIEQLVQLGLAGVALGMFYLIIIRVIARSDKQFREQLYAAKEQDKLHRQERKEDNEKWRSQAEKSDQAIRLLADAVRDINRSK